MTSRGADLGHPVVPRFSLRAMAAVLAVLTVAAVCIRLGYWQLDRLEQRRGFNEVARSAMALPPLDLNSGGLDSLATDPTAHLYRRAVARGRFDAPGEIVLRGRAYDGRPGVHVVAPLRLPDQGMILVNRGWLPSPDAATVDPRPFRAAGDIAVEGLLYLVPDASGEAAPVRISLDGLDLITFRRLDRTTLADSLGIPPHPLYLQQLPDPRPSGELPLPVPPPQLDEGPHLGYAIQWFSFAAIALIGLGIMVVRGRGRKLPLR